MSGLDPSGTAAPPPAAVLESLHGDDWALLLPHVRAALHDLEDTAVTPAVARLRAAPTSRLVGGRTRRELCRLLASGGILWQTLVSRLAEVDDLPVALRWLPGGEAPPAAVDARSPTGSRRGVGGGGETTGGQGRAGTDSTRLRERLRAAREERDVARRRADGAEARAAALEQSVEALRRQLEEARAEVADLHERLDDAAADRRGAVDRERRRRDAEIATLREELSALRHAEQERRAEERRRGEARDQAGRAAGTAAHDRSDADSRAPRLVPGRPSRLPEGVVSGTTEAAALLLGPGRLVLVDGYNVTKQHRAHLDLEGQRSWLVQVLARLAAQRQVRPVVVFDGQRAGGGRPLAGNRDVRVQFTGDGITADDELVLAVEATDEPVVVVTDDRDLAVRLAVSGADVVGTAPFLWAVG